MLKQYYFKYINSFFQAAGHRWHLNSVAVYHKYEHAYVHKVQSGYMLHVELFPSFPGSPTLERYVGIYSDLVEAKYDLIQMAIYRNKIADAKNMWASGILNPLVTSPMKKALLMSIGV